MKIFVIGPHGAGKSTLVKALCRDQGPVPKTQMVECFGNLIDTPGEYLELPRFYRALLVSSQPADVVMWVIGKDDTCFEPAPGLAQMFNKPVIGVVSKSDLEVGDVSKAIGKLRYAGVDGPIFVVSALTGQGLVELARCLDVGELS